LDWRACVVHPEMKQKVKEVSVAPVVGPLLAVWPICGQNSQHSTGRR
jgi:hypothetical protein